jgi:hypothetical protein
MQVAEQRDPEAVEGGREPWKPDWPFFHDNMTWLDSRRIPDLDRTRNSGRNS